MGSGGAISGGKRSSVAECIETHPDVEVIAEPLPRRPRSTGSSTGRGSVGSGRSMGTPSSVATVNVRSASSVTCNRWRWINR